MESINNEVVTPTTLSQLAALVLQSCGCLITAITRRYWGRGGSLHENEPWLTKQCYSTKAGARRLMISAYRILDVSTHRESAT